MATVLIIGDTHCPGMHRRYPAFLKKVAEEWGCNKVVHIGDLVDWHSLSFHQRSTGAPSAMDEYKKAKRQVSRIYNLFPRADWLLGNHDSLTMRQAQTVGIPVELMLDQKVIWEVPRWTVHPRYASIEIDGVLYTHGEVGKGGQFASVKQSRDNFQSTVCGHFHAESGVWWSANTSNLVFAMSVGTGIDHSKVIFEYGQKFSRKPIVSAGVVVGGKEAYIIPMPIRKPR